MTGPSRSPKDQLQRVFSDETKLAHIPIATLAQILKAALPDISTKTAKRMLTVFGLALAAAAPLRRDELIKELGIKVVGEGKIKLVLNETPRVDFLRQVQDITLALYGRPAIQGQCLKIWAGDPRFTEKGMKGSVIAVNGHVANSTQFTRAEQESQGWNTIELADLVVAHAAYFLVTGEDLFGVGAARCRGGALGFYDYGLGLYDGSLEKGHPCAATALVEG